MRQTLTAFLLGLAVLAGGQTAGAVTLDFETLTDLEPVTSQFAGLTFTKTTALVSALPRGSLNEVDLPPLSDAVTDIRATTITANTVQADASPFSFNGGHGIVLGLRSTLRVRLGSDISNNAGDGVQIASGSAVDFRGDVISTVSGNGGFGLRCFSPEDSFSGNTSGIDSGTPNAAGGIAPACTPF